MVRKLKLYDVLGAAALGLATLLTGCSSGTGKDVEKTGTAAGKDIGEHIYPPVAKPGPEPEKPAESLTPIVISGGRIAVVRKQEVPSQRDGQILVIGTEVLPGEPEPPPNLKMEIDVPFIRREVEDNEKDKKTGKERRYVTFKDGDPIEPGKILLGKDPKVFRRLQDGDEVKAGQVVAIVDPALAFDELQIKDAKLVSAEADWKATVKTREEAEKRRDIMQQLYKNRAASLEEVRGAELTVDRYRMEEISKFQAINLARRELSQARTTLLMHEIRSKINGVIRSVYKKQGEAVRSLEPVMQIQGPQLLQIEGLVEVQYLPILERMKRKNEKLVVEPTQPIPPLHQFNGHLGEVHCVAVTNDPKNPMIVSGSEDRTVRVWDWNKKREHVILPHGSPVRTVACTPLGAKANLCLSGTLEGKGYLWDLSEKKPDQPLRTLTVQHKGAITCAAFTPDGQYCFTGGEDRAIYMWDTDTGKPLYQFPAGHRGRVTALHFLPHYSQLISAGGDNTMILWTVGKDNARLEEKSRLGDRGGDVQNPGVSPDGERVLLDQGKEIRILSLADRRTVGVLHNPSGSGNFTTMALFSPDGKMILTAASSEGRMQLWRAPNGTSRTYEMRQLVWNGSPANCGAFIPEVSADKVVGTRFVVTGMKDRQVLVWRAPSSKEIDQQFKADIKLIDRSLDSASRQVRIWAEMENPIESDDDGSAAGANALPRYLLVPGSTATLVATPK